MRNRLIVVLIMLLACGFVSAWEIEDINGTWVDNEELLKSPQRHRSNYYWGRGITIVDASLDIDLEPKTVMIPGMGLYIIDTVSKDEQDFICLQIFYVGDKKHEDPIQMKIRFLDTRRIYIQSDHWQARLDKRYSPEEVCIWYRLSGPPQKPAPTPPAN